jgi:hypothetical protein
MTINIDKNYVNVCYNDSSNGKEITSFKVDEIIKNNVKIDDIIEYIVKGEKL